MYKPAHQKKIIKYKKFLHKNVTLSNLLRNTTVTLPALRVLCQELASGPDVGLVAI